MKILFFCCDKCAPHLYVGVKLQLKSLMKLALSDLVTAASLKQNLFNIIPQNTKPWLQRADVLKIEINHIINISMSVEARNTEND